MGMRERMIMLASTHTHGGTQALLPEIVHQPFNRGERLAAALLEDRGLDLLDLRDQRFRKPGMPATFALQRSFIQRLLLEADGLHERLEVFSPDPDPAADLHRVESPVSDVSPDAVGIETKTVGDFINRQ
jgi:hypothetical protein